MAEHKILIDDCEDAWDESVAAGVTSVLDNADYKVGAGSAKISPDATVAAGTILATEAMAPVDLSDCKIAKLWIKSSVDTALGDLQILLDNNANCASPEETLDVPALAAGVWSLCDLPLANPESDTAIISKGLKYVTDLGACDIRVDDVNGCIVTPEYAQTLIRGWYPTLDKSIPVKVGDDGTVQVFDPAVFNSLVVYEGTATADGPNTSTITDTVLATKPDFNGQLVVITSGDYKGQTRDIDQATDIAGGQVHAAKAFDGIIVEGVTYRILSIRPTTAEVADIEAKLDHVAWGLSALAGLNRRPTPHLIETWQTEAIDATIWGTSLVGTGDAIFYAAEPPYLRVWLSGIAAADEACLYGIHRWFCNPDTAMANYLEKSIFQVLHMEFEARFDDAVILDNTKFFMGLGSIQAAIETTNNIVGFILDASDNLRFQSSDAVGSTSVGAVVELADLADWHKYEIVISPGQVQCFIDGVSGGIITANMPETAMYPVFHLVQEAGGGNPDLHIGIIRIWSEDILR